MSLVQQCLESFGSVGYGYHMSSEEAAKYTVDNGAFLINMESTLAVSEMYNIEYELESAYARSCAEAKRLGVPVEEGIGGALSKVKSKLSEVWTRARDWFAKMKSKVLGWFENVKKVFREMFAKPKSAVKEISDSEVKCYMDGDDLIITVADDSNKSSSSPKPAAPKSSGSSGSSSSPKPAAPKSSGSSGAEAFAVHDDGKGKRGSVNVKNFKVFTYTNIDGYDSQLASMYAHMRANGANMVDGVIKLYNDRKKEFMDKAYALEERRKEKGTEISTRKMLDGVDKAASRKVQIIIDALNNGMDKMMGELLDIHVDDNLAKNAYAFFRNGATSEDDKKAPSDSRNLIAEARAALAKDNTEKKLTLLQREAAKTFDLMIDKLKTWEMQLNKSASTPPEFVSAVNKLVGTFSKAQSTLNTVTNAWIAANRERLAVYSQVIAKVAYVKHKIREKERTK